MNNNEAQQSSQLNGFVFALHLWMTHKTHVNEAFNSTERAFDRWKYNNTTPELAVREYCQSCTATPWWWSHVNIFWTTFYFLRQIPNERANLSFIHFTHISDHILRVSACFACFSSSSLLISLSVHSLLTSYSAAHCCESWTWKWVAPMNHWFSERTDE